MKYCIHYHRNSPFRYFDELDEIDIQYRKEDVTLPDFLEKYASKMIVMTVTYQEDLPRLVKLAEKYKNFKIKINSIWDKQMVNSVLETGIPFFFSQLIDSWDLFYSVVEMHPTDIYVTNELGFEIKTAAEIAHKNGIQIRVIPNVAQSTWEKTPDIKKFFIRPEDVPAYEPYVDVMEFSGREEQYSVYYEIYAHDKQWFGQLDEIIYGFNSNMDNRCIISMFGESRTKCGKKCLKGQPCHICERAEHLAKTLSDQNLLLIQEKKDTDTQEDN